MIHLKIIVCMVVAGVTGAACAWLHNLEKTEYQSAQFIDNKSCDSPKEQDVQPSGQKSHDISQEDTAQGESIWLLRQINKGHPTHWVIYTHGKKYELRSLQRGPFRRLFMWAPRFEPHVTGGIRPDKREGLHEQAPLWLHMSVRCSSKFRASYHYRGSYICMIGRTTLTSDQVQQAFNKAKFEFGTFIVPFHCQRFLDRFLDRIIAPEDRVSGHKKVIAGESILLNDRRLRRKPRRSQMNHGRR